MKFLLHMIIFCFKREDGRIKKEKEKININVECMCKNILDLLFAGIFKPKLSKVNER